MISKRNFIKILLFSFLGCLLIATSGFAQGKRESFTLEGDITKTFKMDSGGLVSIDNHNGRIEFESWDKNEVEINIRERYRGGRDEIEIRIDADSKEVKVSAIHPDRRSRWGDNDRRNEAHFVVKVPKSVNIRAESHNGDIFGDQMNGDMDARTHNGAIEFGDITGNLILESHNGDIDVSNVKGEIEAKTHNGHILFKNVEGKQIYAESHNGGLRGDFKIITGGDYEFNTYNGRVDVILPADSKFDVDIRTRKRNFSTDFKIDGWDERDDNERRSRYYRNDNNRERRIRGKVNGGGPRIRISTNNGNVDLRDR